MKDIKFLIKKLIKLKDNEGLLKYLKNTSWLFSEKIIRLTIGLFIGAWVARYLEPDRFGLLSYTQSFVGLFTIIATLGLNGIIVRELVRNNYQEHQILGTAFVLKLLASFLTILILGIVVMVLSNDSLTNKLVFIIASSTIFQSFNVVDFYFQSKVLSKYVVFSNFIAFSISTAIKIFLIITNQPLIYFAWVIFLDSIILSLGYLFFYSRNTNAKISKWKFNTKLAINLLKDGYPLIISGVAVSIYMRIDQVMIKEMLNDVAVGQYAAAVKLSEAWYFIPFVIASSFFPAIVRAKKENLELYKVRLQKLYNLMSGISVFVAITMTFLGNWIIEILYGLNYNQSAEVLIIHIWAGVFVGLGLVYDRYLTIENFTKKILYKTLLGAALNIIANLILIPMYGINGAAISTILGQFISNYFYDIFDKDLREQLKMKTNSFLFFRTLKMNYKALF